MTRQAVATLSSPDQASTSQRAKESRSADISKRTHATKPIAHSHIRARLAEPKDIQSKIAERKTKFVAKVKEKVEAKERAKMRRLLRLDGNPVPWDRKPQHPLSRGCIYEFNAQGVSTGTVW